jgi:predicted TIM-barrel fold metal-dependent hydrolase
MISGLYITDFHAHLRGLSETMAQFCPADTSTPFFRNTAPLFERLARFSEPLHDGLIRWLALNRRGGLHRHIYGSVAQFSLMEVLRRFKSYDLKCLLRSMQQHGIDRTVIASLEPFITTQEILEIIAPCKEKFVVFASVARSEKNPAEYLRKYIESGQVAGLKIHPVIGGYACNELLEATRETVSLAVAHDLPILIHTGHIPSSTLAGLAGGCNEARAVEPLVAAFPQGKFVLAHIGWESWRYILRLAQKYPNVCVETSWQPAHIIRRAVDVLGAERVLFGSDFPLFKQHVAFRIAQQALTAREFVYVASANANRLLGKPNEGTAGGSSLLA